MTSLDDQYPSSYRTLVFSPIILLILLIVGFFLYITPVLWLFPSVVMPNSVKKEYMQERALVEKLFLNDKRLLSNLDLSEAVCWSSPSLDQIRCRLEFSAKLKNSSRLIKYPVNLKHPIKFNYSPVSVNSYYELSWLDSQPHNYHMQVLGQLLSSKPALIN